MSEYQPEKFTNITDSLLLSDIPNLSEFADGFADYYFLISQQVFPQNHYQKSLSAILKLNTQSFEDLAQKYSDDINNFSSNIEAIQSYDNFLNFIDNNACSLSTMRTIVLNEKENGENQEKSSELSASISDLTKKLLDKALFSLMGIVVSIS